jgi:Na+-translocating ferredoxin:NAD+ oxidoreductase subunit B
MNDVYKRLAEKLDKLPNGFPATEDGLELKILQKIFTPEEAEMALKIRPIPETAEALAERLDIPIPKMQAILDDMAQKGQIGGVKIGGEYRYMLFPFVIGIFEFQLNRLDKELSELVEAYAPALSRTTGHFPPHFARVVPVNSQIKAEHQALLYEDVRQMLETAKSFQVADCICRKESALLGKPCNHMLEACLSFSSEEGAFDRYPLGRTIDKEEALQILDKSEEEGLVHHTYNVKSDHHFICNCCSCCCGIIKGMRDHHAPYMIAKSNYVAMIDQESCTACGVCANERCPVAAIEEIDGVYTVKPERCIGCGVCTPSCPTESISLIRKPESSWDDPPSNLIEWYFKRASSRGIPMSLD